MPTRVPFPPESLSADSKHLHDLPNKGTDASVNYIDACLASIIAKRLLKSAVTDKLLDSLSGAIGSFAARLDLAYILALIDKLMYQDLLVLAKLRNETGFVAPGTLVQPKSELYSFSNRIRIRATFRNDY